MKYLVALALAFGTLALASMDVQAAYRCGPSGCYHYYAHRSQWPVGGAQTSHYYNYWKYRYPHRSRWPVGGA
jgi:hypothetical protein